jgi:hypothetical protein
MIDMGRDKPGLVITKATCILTYSSLHTDYRLKYLCFVDNPYSDSKRGHSAIPPGSYFDYCCRQPPNGPSMARSA